MPNCQSDLPGGNGNGDGPRNANGSITPAAPTSERGNGYNVDGESESAKNLLTDTAAALNVLEIDDADRREAVRAMYEYLREQGTARKSDFTREVYPEHPAGFGSAGGWWNALGKDALGELPNVRKPPEGRSMWRIDK